MVKALLDRGVSRMMIRRAISQLAGYGDWPLSEATLAVTDKRADRAARGRRRVRALAARVAADGRAAAAGGRSSAP